MNQQFNSLYELYKKVQPALTAKKGELHKIGRTYILEEDIWNCLKESKWKNDINLSLSEMVSDILDCKEDILDSYIKEQIKKIERKVNLESK